MRACMSRAQKTLYRVSKSYSRAGDADRTIYNWLVLNPLFPLENFPADGKTSQHCYKHCKSAAGPLLFPGKMPNTSRAQGFGGQRVRKREMRQAMGGQYEPGGLGAGGHGVRCCESAPRGEKLILELFVFLCNAHSRCVRARAICLCAGSPSGSWLARWTFTSATGVSCGIAVIFRAGVHMSTANKILRVMAL